MTFPPGGGFGDIFGGLGGAASRSTKSEKGIPWEAKVIDGQYYIPLRQMAELLEQNDVLPSVRKGIERRVKEGPPK